MDFYKICLFLTYLFTLSTSAVVHHPMVTEEDTEVINDNFKIAPVISEPDKKPFAFQTTNQQDYLKARYAEQQQINVEEIAKSRKDANSKNIQNIYQNSNLKYNANSEPYDWQTFAPADTKRQRRNVKAYVPLVVKSTKAKRETSEEISTNSRSDLSSSHIIYVDPKIIKKVHELKHKPKQIQSRSVSFEEGTLIETNSLSELLSKNPHIQIDSLKRLLQDPQQRNNFLPVMKGPEPFQTKDHTPINEKTPDVPNPNVKPNIQLNQGESSHNTNINQNNDPLLSSFLPQQGQTLTKEAFDQIQKQVEQSSHFQVQDALLRAQQAAQAHVEAQHKAIEQAQRAILENVQKQLQEASPEGVRLIQQQYNNQAQLDVPQALSLVQNPSMQYNSQRQQVALPQKQEDMPQALPLVQEKLPQYLTHITPPPVYPTPLPEAVSPVHEVTIPSSRVQIHKYKPTVLPNYVSNTASPKKQSYSTLQSLLSQHQVPIQSIQIVKVAQLPKHYYVQSENKAQQKSTQPPSTTPKMEHYAPNHLHQSVTQTKDKKTASPQVPFKNNEFVNKKTVPNRYVGQKTESAVEDKEAHGSANAYQHVTLKTKSRGKLKKVHYDEGSYDENDDLQYAAKYAFGYRIKDNGEGNDFGHEEKRNGRSAEGSYQVLLPDGRRQKVEYYADDTGYHAKVTYENVATHK